MTIKYTYTRGATTIYQRPVPTDLRDRYPGATIKKVLKTTDPAEVARLVADLNRQVEAEWTGLRASPESSPKALKVHATAFLRSWGLQPHSPDNDPRAIEALHAHIDGKLDRHAAGDDHAYQNADPAEYLTPAEREAGRLLHGTRRDTLEDALKVYLKAHRRAGDETFATAQRRILSSLTAVTGDKEVAAFTRQDARAYIDASLKAGRKTGTIRRRVNVLNAVWASYRREQDPQCVNPWERLTIAGEGEDTDERDPYTSEELATLYAACRSADDDRRWIVAMMIDTGARLAEVVGLALDDINLDAPIPHVVFRPYPWRRLKNKESEREVPLVGAALWGAKRVHEVSPMGQRMAFPRYTNEAECRATAASGTLVKWIQRIPINRVAHELRHTMKDRLREVQCPKSIYDPILGHAAQDVGEGYGRGYSLKVKSEWLGKVALATPAHCPN